MVGQQASNRANQLRPATCNMLGVQNARRRFGRPSLRLQQRQKHRGQSTMASRPNSLGSIVCAQFVLQAAHASSIEPRSLDQAPIALGAFSSVGAIARASACKSTLLMIATTPPSGSPSARVALALAGGFQLFPLSPNLFSFQLGRPSGRQIAHARATRTSARPLAFGPNH